MAVTTRFDVLKAEREQLDRVETDLRLVAQKKADRLPPAFDKALPTSAEQFDALADVCQAVLSNRFNSLAGAVEIVEEMLSGAEGYTLEGRDVMALGRLAAELGERPQFRLLPASDRTG